MKGPGIVGSGQASGVLVDITCSEPVVASSSLGYFLSHQTVSAGGRHVGVMTPGKRSMSHLVEVATHSQLLLGKYYLAQDTSVWSKVSSTLSPERHITCGIASGCG